MTDIVRRAGTILGRIVRIPEAKPEVALERRVTEERARVVNRVGPGVRAEDQQTGLANLLRTDVEGESMIPREALIAAAVHTGQARPVDAVGPKARTTTAAGAGADREQEQATAALIQVVQRVEVITARAEVRHGSDDTLAEDIVLDRAVPLLGSRRDQVIVQHARRTGYCESPAS